MIKELFRPELLYSLVDGWSPHGQVGQSPEPLLPILDELHACTHLHKEHT